MAKVLLSGYRCERCGHEWLPRQTGEEPKVCPKCKSPYWNSPRKMKPRRNPDATSAEEG